MTYALTKYKKEQKKKSPIDHYDLSQITRGLAIKMYIICVN